MGSVGCEDLLGLAMWTILCVCGVLVLILALWCVSIVTGHRPKRKRLRRAERAKAHRAMPPPHRR